MTCPATWFAAAFHGVCSDCGVDIKPDDMVLPDGRGGHLCEGCGQEGTTVTADEEERAPEPFPEAPMVISQPEDMGMDRDAPAVGEARAHEFPEGQWPRTT